jgi:hypothetical protein
MVKPPTVPVYEIHVRGVLGGALLEAFPTLSGVARGGDTFLTGELADQAALHGALSQIESFGLELIALHRVDSAKNVQARTAPQSTSRPAPKFTPNS